MKGIPNFALVEKVTTTLESALRLADERSILSISGKADGVPFVISMAAGPGAERLLRILEENGTEDPRGATR